MDDLVRFGVLTQQMAEFLRACVIARLNVLVSGGAGAGRKTFLGSLTSFVPVDERVVLVSEPLLPLVDRLQRSHPDALCLETGLAGPGGEAAPSRRDLLRSARYMRPDRVVVDEVEGGEALDLIRWMSTGLDGCLTSAYADDPADALLRLEHMATVSQPDLPAHVLRHQMASALSLVVHQDRLRDGSRRITHVAEVVGVKGDRLALQDVFTLRQTGVDDGRIVGQMVGSGISPRCVERLQAANFLLPPDTFATRQWPPPYEPPARSTGLRGRLGLP